MKIKLLLFASLFFITNLYSQIIFEENFGNSPSIEQANSIIQHDDVVVLAGITTLQTNGGDDILLVKLDTLGNLIWKKNFGGVKNDRANEIRLLNDGYLLAGHTKSFGAGNQDFYLIKTDFDGNLIWERTYGTPMLESCVDVRLTAEGGFLMFGNAINDEEQGEDWLLIKTDAMGNEEWSNYYGTPYYDRPILSQTLSDGSYLIYGLYNGYWRILKIDTNGGLVWEYGEWSSNPIGWNISTGDVLELENNDLLVYTSPLRLYRLSADGNEIYVQNYWNLGAPLNVPLKIQMITEDSILLLNQFDIIAVDPEDGEELGEFDWFDPDQLFSVTRDFAISNHNYYVASDHRTFYLTTENYEHNGILMEKFNSVHEKEIQYIDTFTINFFYEEYAENIVETSSGELLLLGLRKFRDSDFFSDKVLLTRTDANGAIISELEFDKGHTAKPLDLLSAADGNTFLLTLINADTIELSSVDQSGTTLWNHYFEGDFDIESTVKIGTLQSSSDDQYRVIIDGLPHYIFDETGNIDAATGAGTAATVKAFPNGDFLYFNNNNISVYNSEGSLLQSNSVYSTEYGFIVFLDAYIESDEEIWLTAVTDITGTDSVKYLLLEVNRSGHKIFESTLGTFPEEEITSLKFLSVETDRLIVYGNQEKPWPYDPYSNRDNCLLKPLSTSFLEEWDYAGNLLSRLELGVGEGVQLSNMILTADGNFAGAGWKYAMNSDDQYLVKIDRGAFVPATEAGLSDKNALLLFPNPTRDYLQLRLESRHSGLLGLHFFNSAGQLVLTREIEDFAQGMNASIDLSQLPPGIYFLQSEIDGKSLTTQRWIKM